MSALIWHAALYLAAGLALALLALAAAVARLYPPSRRFVWAWLAWTVTGLVARLLALQAWLEARARAPASPGEVRS